MNTFYVDESGSMTKKGLDKRHNRYFIVCMILTNDSKKLLRVYKRFISSNIDKLRKTDKHNKMFFKNGKFKELKGSSLTIEMKQKFINFFCRNRLFDIYYICSDNKKAEDIFYSNTSRAFNYLLKLSIDYNSSINNIKKSINYFYIDERNIRTDSKATLREYLNTELVSANHLQKLFVVEYCNSESKELIQVADVFSNIYYTYLAKDTKLDKDIKKLIDKKYIKNEFYFPVG